MDAPGNAPEPSRYLQACKAAQQRLKILAEAMADTQQEKFAREADYHNELQIIREVGANDKERVAPAAAAKWEAVAAAAAAAHAHANYLNAFNDAEKAYYLRVESADQTLAAMLSGQGDFIELLSNLEAEKVGAAAERAQHALLIHKDALDQAAEDYATALGV